MHTPLIRAIFFFPCFYFRIFSDLWLKRFFLTNQKKKILRFSLPLFFGGMCNLIIVSFRSKYDVKWLMKLKNRFCRLLNKKHKLSVFYYIVELLWQIVETIWKYNYCRNYLEIVQMLTMIVKKEMKKGVFGVVYWVAFSMFASLTMIVKSVILW